MGTIIYQEQFQQLLQHTFGTRIEVVKSQVANRQQDYVVMLLQLRRPTLEVVVKLAGPEAVMPSTFDRTAMLDRLVAAQTSIPMPETLAVNISLDNWPWRYLIKTHIPGQELALVRKKMSADELSDAYRQIGEAVAQLHAIHFPWFGVLALEEEILGGEEYFPALALHAQLIIRSARLRESFLSLLEAKKHLFQDVHQPCLCHEDLHGWNLLFQRRRGQWRLATILDFDKAWAGHCETDLARLDFWRGMVSEAFWGAYQAVHAIDPQYTERRPIYQLLWCLEYAQMTAEHLADTQRLCAELSLPRLERFD